MLSDKKKNTEVSYTLDELETEINSLSGPEGKTVTFRNLDSSGGQHIEVVQSAVTHTQSNSAEFSITAKFPTINFWVSSHAGYVPGELDHTSPLDLSTLEGDVTITAQAGYTNPTEGRQLVDMSNWCKNNPDMIVGKRFTEAAKEYFKTVKPTTLNGFINEGKVLVDATPINLLDTSECTSFNGAFLIRSESINEKKKYKY